MELTREYFDQQLNKRLKGLATKDDLKTQTQELKEYTDKQTETLARIISTTVAEPMELHFAQMVTKQDLDKRITDLGNLISIRFAFLEKEIEDIKRDFKEMSKRTLDDSNMLAKDIMKLLKRVSALEERVKKLKQKQTV